MGPAPGLGGSVALLSAFALLCAPAQGFESCDHDAGVVTATYGTETTGTLVQSGSALHTEDGQCDGATTANTETIVVVGDAAAETLTIDLAGGTFLGGTNDGDGTQEIEINVDFGPDSTPPSQGDAFFPQAPTEVTILGTPGVEDVELDTFGPESTPADRFTAVNLNAAGSTDTDVVFDDRRFVEVRGLGGSDVLTALVPGQGSALGDPIARLVGGPGDDDVGNDYVVPGPGSDTIRNQFGDNTTVSYLDAPFATSIVLGAGFMGTTPNGDGESPPGTDTYLGSAPRIVGSTHDDDFDATAAPSTESALYYGADGEDDITGGDDTTDGLSGGPGDDVIRGLGEQDDLHGDEDDDTLFGGEGPDTLLGGPGDDDEFGEEGFDEFHQASFFVPEDQRAGPNGADDLHGGPDDDIVLYGDQNNDFPEPFTGRTAGVRVDLDDAADDGGTGEGDNVHSDVEVAFGGLGPDTFVGNAGFNAFAGLHGDDLFEIRGGGADSVLCGEGGDVVRADDEDTADGDCEIVDRGGGDGGGDDGGGDGTTPPPGGDPPPVPPVAPPLSPPGLPPPVVTPPAAAPPVSRILRLPSSRRCASRRKFTVRVRREIRGQVRRVTISLNGRRVKRVTGRRLGLPIDLRGLPKGRVRVRLRVELTDGRVATDTRTYRTCATKKRRGQFGRRRG
ncbi:MAG TPA: calcium-binding protein [Solirubrobacteraceae bacterium]|jgi:hypothetical protein